VTSSVMVGSKINMLLVVAAAPLETVRLREEIFQNQISWGETLQVFSDCPENPDVVLFHSGIGQINMASRMAQILQTCHPEAVILCGCGGSYPSSGLHNGDMVLATTESLADFGVVTANQFIPMEQLNIPVDLQLAPPTRQDFPLDKNLLNWARQTLPEAICGPFATVNSCSGSPELSRDLEQRSGAICENMEGAAAAQVCDNFKVPLLEVRGISNPTGTRDPNQWDVARGADIAQHAVLKLLKHWPIN